MVPYNAELTERRRFDRKTVTQASVCAACAEWSWLLAHAFAHGCQLPRCDGRTSLVTASYAYARHVQRVPPASAAAPSGASSRVVLELPLESRCVRIRTSTEGRSETLTNAHTWQPERFKSGFHSESEAKRRSSPRPGRCHRPSRSLRLLVESPQRAPQAGLAVRSEKRAGEMVPVLAQVHVSDSVGPGVH